MNPSEEKKKWLEDMLQMLSGTVTKSEFLSAFKAATEMILKSEIKLSEKIDTKLSDTSTEIDSLKSEVKQAIEKMKVATDSTFSQLKTRSMESINALFNKMRLNEKFAGMVNEMMAEHRAKMSAMDAQIATIPSKEEFLALIPPPIGPIKETAEETRDLLETLKEDDRLDKSAIKGLDEAFTEIKTIASQRVQTPAKSYQIHTVDLTSQVDGAETTFNVGGSHFGIMGVYSTQAPLIFRPIIDYVETRNGFTLQGITIQSGQTLTAQFLK